MFAAKVDRVKIGRDSVIFLVALLAAAVGTDSAWARGGRGGGGHRGGAFHGGGGHVGGHRFHGGTALFIGAPLYFGSRYYYPAPYYYPPYYPPGPSYYIEQPQQGYWHYCPQAGAYYPQVQTCPGGWQLVPPQPQSGY